MCPQEGLPDPVPAANGDGEERVSGLLIDLARCPATGATLLAAVVVSVVVWGGEDVWRFAMAEPVFAQEPWRLLTSALPHVNVLHLLFNVWWTWVLGKVVEERIGSLCTLGLILLLAVTSSAAEYVVFSGGVGLSGVVYGLFGFLWARGRTDPSIRESIPKGTARLFVIWFFVCIVLTYSELMPIGNVAHGAGCLVGGMIGLGWRWRTLAFSAGAVTLAATARPYVNLGGTRGFEYSYHSWLAGKWGDEERAVRWGAEAVSIDAQDAHAWFNLGRGLHGLERYGEALTAYERALQLDPQLAEFVDIEGLRAYISNMD